ncbi:tetratricopeptide repeat protein [Egbenema bharatensis]|uniref:tetratricopeptide repeat protein n=1 Tax=Egbenema bharatensis TaxID=3463334 RepID=UPI003A8A65D6
MSRSLPTDQHDREWEQENLRNFRKLLLSVQASLKQLNLLIAICDHPTYREELIRDYEAQLTAKGITCLRVQLDRHQTSLKQALLALAAEEPALYEDQPVMVTVCGADQMLSVRLDQEQSAREQFFFSLQWTREALRQFQFPIVIWLTEQITRELTQQAPDFWSWRGGVFQFVRPIGRSDNRSSGEFQDFQLEAKPKKPISLAESRQKIQELQKQIATLEVQDPESPLLPSLYSSLGEAYEERLDNGLVAAHAKEQQLAIQAYEKAIALQTEEDSVELARTLKNLANLYRSMGRYSEAEPLFVRSLAIYEQQLGADHPHTATSLNNLAGLYRSMGRYSEAEPLFVRSLAIYEQQLGADHPHTATSLNNLAGLYRSMGRYSEAEPLFVRSLDIYEQQLGADHPHTATSLNNLAGLYDSMGRYSEAEPLFVRSLAICEQQLGADHPDTATSLNNLAGLYDSMGRYSEAEPLFVRGLGILFNSLGETHPKIQTGWANFLSFLQQVIEAGQTDRLSDHPTTQRAIEQLRQSSGEMAE